jgi:very-short-patch-repair endonuclease
MSIFQETIISDIERFKTIVNESNGIGEMCRRYNFCDNGKVRNIIKEFIKEYKLDTSHFGLKNHPKKYQFIEKKCPICENNFVTQINHPREKFTCSHKCGNLFFRRKHTEEEKNKIGKGLKKHHDSVGRNIPISIICKSCKKPFNTKHKRRVYCSNKCSVEDRINNPIYIQHLKEGVRRSVLEGRHKSWTSRKIVSYPEKFFMTVLKNNNIEYKHNKKIDRFFIDFAIEKENKKIALEIDGKQHKYPDRILKDQEKDKFLTTDGWVVYRLEWNSINTEDGKKLIKEKIDKFLDTYNQIYDKV